MFDLGVFFRRNRAALWVLVAAFLVIFISIQISKALSKLDSHYGEIAECTYTHQGPELQNPQLSMAQREQEDHFCATKG